MPMGLTRLGSWTCAFPGRSETSLVPRTVARTGSAVAAEGQSSRRETKPTRSIETLGEFTDDPPRETGLHRPPWACLCAALPLRASLPARASVSSPVTRRRLDRSIHHRLAGHFRLVGKNVPDTPGRQIRIPRITAARHRLDQRVQRRLIDVRLLPAVRWRRRALVGDG